MNETTTAAFFDELGNIQKEAGVGDFFIRGIKGLQRAGKGLKQHVARGKIKGPVQKGQEGMGLAAHGQSIKNLYRQGAETVGKGGKPGGVLGGLKALGKSDYGAMAGTAGVAGLGAYGAGKAVFGD